MAPETQKGQNATSKGLNIPVHPLLNEKILVDSLPKLNPKRKAYGDSTKYNPYLDASGASRKRPKAFNFNPQGKYIEEAKRIREQEKIQHEEQKKQEELARQGLVPNREIGEHLYETRYPPDIEWWDKFYVKSYNDLDNVIVDNESHPVTLYIQHPVFMKPAFDKHLPGEIPMYLTKKELKRKRKNERQEKFKLQQERVQKGLDPPPPPKVKLSNLMNVLTNEAIKDPTAVEKKVKKEVEQRYNQHMKRNEERKLTTEQRHEKQHKQRESDLSKGYYRSVYRIDKLVDLQHFFKVDKNAQQLELRGLCIVNDKFSLIVVEGGSKLLKYYDKLLMKRIDWSKSDNHDLSNNKIYKVWSGQMKELTFKKWSLIKTKDEQDLNSLLTRFDVENYWRESSIIS